MKPSRGRISLLSVLLPSAAALFAGPRLSSLDIRVVLSRNGDAHITEVREMDIDDVGTECYIVIGNLNGSQVRDFEVKDENGRYYFHEQDWDVGEDRQWKANKCGINQAGDGCELCWGLGEEGWRTYTATYTVTSLLRGFSDADGFNYMFVARGIQPSPEHVRLSIVADSDSVRFSQDNTAIWAFSYRGDIRFEAGSIVAESSEPFGDGSAMIVMCAFQKGMFEPQVNGGSSFEDVKEAALEGSDYDLGYEGWCELICLAVFGLFTIAAPISHAIYVFVKRRKINKGLLWYRDIPYGGDLQRANGVISAYKYFGANYNNLLSACILRLINMGAIAIEQQMSPGSKPQQRFPLSGSGKAGQCFVIKELKDADRQPRLLRMVYGIFKKAAGGDTVLQPHELKAWMKSSFNQSYTDAFIQALQSKKSIYDIDDDEIGEVRKLFGLKKFLKEFSLLGERHVSEVALWKDYMVYATLFGIAGQVISDMKKINPEYFQMDKVASQMADDITLPMICSAMHNSYSRAAMSKAQREARASGGGGSSSWGGGGGFSGGGSGGGVR